MESNIVFVIKVGKLKDSINVCKIKKIALTNSLTNTF